MVEIVPIVPAPSTTQETTVKTTVKTETFEGGEVDVDVKDKKFHFNVLWVVLAISILLIVATACGVVMTYMGVFDDIRDIVKASKKVEGGIR